ncbi:hypothetical protein [Flavobacterium sp. TAB 87]|uniref:hypothetical protein n=1 Tax=Flavobacterium sp. TAB 87 TaxID=1729581 RepID=UPI00076BE7EE|nr:hypothetical protein [Flavobacterium sp. TAB 87]KVV15004.1 hypothetical protein AP058_01562 [Flavobacterium sp. TAB 87]
MQKRSNLIYANLEDLELDINNPRFGELYNGSKNEEDLIEYLLFEEAAEEIAKSIAHRNEFYEDKALWVIKNSAGKFTVRDGNRRCAAVKALQMPGRFKLSESKTPFAQLPVYEYTDEDELKSRIGEEHAASLFRSWERIAKALQILDLANTGKQDEMNTLDSRPGDFIKLGSFYKEAVKYGGDEFRKQIRRGRGKTGGKTIIYERLFRDAKVCGYKFKNSPTFKIEITDTTKFKSYIRALVKYIETFPETKTSDIDGDKSFIKRLKDYGFDINQKNAPDPTRSATIPSATITTQGIRAPTGATISSAAISPVSNSTKGSGGTPASSITSPISASVTATTPIASKRGTVKQYPDIKRKQFPLGLKSRIDEYFEIDSSEMPNAKVAMARVTYECVLKYVVEKTKSGAIIFSNSGHFGSAYSRRPHTNFDEMNKKFIELIINTGIAQAFRNFEFDKMHQTIHNYHVSSKSIDADQIKMNLIILLEFMLQDVDDLLISLDISKIR